MNALSFVAVIGSLLLMRLPKHVPKPHNNNAFGDLKEGLTYVNNTPSIKFILIMLAIISLFVLPFATLIPVYAKDIFHGTASTFGVIDSVIGFGALSGAIFLASLRPGIDMRKILAINTLIFGAGLVLFSHETHYYLALIFAVIGGFGMMSQMTLSNTMIQMTVAPNMRGRVISFYAMAFFGMQPLGGLIVGSLSAWIDVQNTVLFEGCVALLVGVLHFRFLRRNKKKMQALRQQVEMAGQPPSPPKGELIAG
jgi:MFS family permease